MWALRPRPVSYGRGADFRALCFRMVGGAGVHPGHWLTGRERLFCMLAYTPKATVQAAIGSVPLAMGLACGQTVLAVAVLAILITAPLGSVAIEAPTGGCCKRIKRAGQAMPDRPFFIDSTCDTSRKVFSSEQSADDAVLIHVDAFGRRFFGRPGMVMMLPMTATTKPAPADRRSSRTVMVKPSGAASSLALSLKEYWVLAMHTGSLS